jgi:CubicO group peptidase (beta-lactamase class C family)
MRTTPSTWWLLLCLSALRAGAQPLAQRFDSLFTASGHQQSLNGNVVVAQHGRILYQRSFGYADFEKKIPNTAQASFNIASVSKTFTATAILQLAAQGKLDLEDALVKHLPEFPFPSLTIRHLLSHTSGLPDYEIFSEAVNKHPSKRFGSADVIPALVAYGKPLKFEPGQQWAYCNTNYELLALLVEKISRLSFATYLKQHIFLPARMSKTYVQNGPESRVDPKQVNTYVSAKLYQSTYLPVDSVHHAFLDQIRHNLSSIPGAGMIVSTVADLLRYDEALYSGKLLSEAWLEKAFTPMRLPGGRDYDASLNPRLGKSYYGLGWEILADTTHGRIVSHGGSYPGIVSLFLRNTTRQQTIVLFDNTAWTGVFFLGRMASQLLNNEPVNQLLPKQSLVRVFGQALMREEVTAARHTLIALRTDTAQYSFSEQEFNRLGYQFLQDGYPEKAAETFQLTVLLYPQSFNAYDSYGDALAACGKKEAAVRMYQQSLAINPTYQEAQEKVSKLLK